MELALHGRLNDLHFARRALPVLRQWQCATVERTADEENRHGNTTTARGRRENHCATHKRRNCFNDRKRLVLHLKLMVYEKLCTTKYVLYVFVNTCELGARNPRLRRVPHCIN